MSWDTPNGEDPGLSRVKTKFGPTMVQRLKNYPLIARNLALAETGDDQIAAEEERKAGAQLERARIDAEYAVTLATAAARTVPRSEWDVVPTVVQLVRSTHLADEAAADAYMLRHPSVAEGIRRRLEVSKKAGIR